jgi:hypothetical protein
MVAINVRWRRIWAGMAVPTFCRKIPIVSVPLAANILHSLVP